MPRGTVVLDSGALSAIAAGGTRARAALRRALEARSDIVVPSVVLAESTVGSGPRDARVNAVVAQARVAAVTESRARLAGAIRHRAASTATIDAIVAAEALSAPGRAVILTSERGRTDFDALLRDHPPQVSVSSI